MYTLEYLNGLYCVFRHSRIIAAFKTKADAHKAVARYLGKEI